MEGCGHALPLLMDPSSQTGLEAPLRLLRVVLLTKSLHFSYDFLASRPLSLFRMVQIR
jgi:hypothetical protein